MRVRFEWNPSKASINLRKHGVSFEEACTVFDGPLAAIFADEDHSIEEAREIIIGYSILKRLVLVCSPRLRERQFGSSALDRRRDERDKIMKSTSKKTSKRKTQGDLQPEYRFDYSKAQPNRFAGRKASGQVVVVLDPDVARVFKDPASVNAALRALLSAVPRARTAGKL